MISPSVITCWPRRNVSVTFAVRAKPSNGVYSCVDSESAARTVQVRVGVDERDVGVVAHGDVRPSSAGRSARAGFHGDQLARPVVAAARGVRPSLTRPGSRYSAPPKPDLARKTSSRGSPNFSSSLQHAWSRDDPVDRCRRAGAPTAPRRPRAGAAAGSPCRRRRARCRQSASRWPMVTSRRKSMCGNASRHQQRRLDRLARRQVQQVDGRQLGLVREVRRDGDREALGVRRPRGAVGREAGQRAVLLDELRVRAS